MLIIHETDCHGCGTVYYNGTEVRYSYDDEIGDIRRAVEFLIEIGFVNSENVLIFDSHNSIYEQLDDFLRSTC